MISDRPARIAVFPARAGMSRTIIYIVILRMSVPRASGDEPDGSKGKTLEISCSPRERG